MFNAHYFAARFFAPRYFPEVGADAVAGGTGLLALTNGVGYLVISQTA